MNENEPKKDASDSIQAFYTAWLKEAFGTLSAYFVLFTKVVGEPDKTANDIKQHQIDIKLLVRGLTGGLVIAGMIDLVVWLFSGPGNESAPDFFMALLFMLFIFIGAAIVHPPLKWMGGTASLQETFYANAIASAVSPPVTSLALVFSAWFGMEESFAGYISAALLLPILSSAHQISQLKVALTVFVIVPIGIFIISLAIILALDIEINENETPETYQSQPQVQYGTTCQTYLGSCPVVAQPVGNVCFCINPYTYERVLGTVQ